GGRASPPAAGARGGGGRAGVRPGRRGAVRAVAGRGRRRVGPRLADPHGRLVRRGRLRDLVGGPYRPAVAAARRARTREGVARRGWSVLPLGRRVRRV